MARDFCLLIIFSCSLFGSESFWFSYQVAVENKMVVYEQKNVSAVMQVADSSDYRFLCSLDASKKSTLPTQQYLNKNFAQLLGCFYPMSAKVENYTIIKIDGVLERTVVTIAPVRFTVDFKDDFATIEVIK